MSPGDGEIASRSSSADDTYRDQAERDGTVREDVDVVDLTGGAVTSLDALLADPTPAPDRPTGVSYRTNVRSGLGVGEAPDAAMVASSGESDPTPPVSYMGSSAGLLLQIPVDAIRPNEFQPRRRFDETALAALSESVQELGVLQPILVRRLVAGADGHASGQTTDFELIAGERRWRAARRAGLAKVPAIVRDVTDLRSLEEAIVENLHRSDLNPLEEAAAYQQLIDEFGLSQAQVATRVGKSRSAVANTLRLVQLPVAVQRLVVSGDLSAGHARAVLAVPSFDQPDFAQRIVAGELTVRRAEEMAQNWSEVRRGRRSDGMSGRSDGTKDSAASGSKQRSSGALEAEMLLAERLDTRVRVDESAKGGGRIVIDFADEQDLTRIFQLLSGEPDR